MAIRVRMWLYGRCRRSIIRRSPRASLAARWQALEWLASRPPPDWLLRKLAGLIELGLRTRRSLRRAAAIALIYLTRGQLPQEGRLQEAHARGLALSLPRRLATPHVVASLLSVEECARIVAEAEAHGAASGWGSLHRRYPTVDLPLHALPSGVALTEVMRARALPHFERCFGHGYGPPETLRFRDLFVAKYDAETENAQRGLSGHVDASLLSLVLQLSAADSFDGGGTFFEHCEQLIQPGQGGAVLFLGKVYHAAKPITRGRRYVLVALLDRTLPVP